MFTESQLKTAFENRYVPETWTAILRENFNANKLHKKPVDITAHIKENSYKAKAFELGSMETIEGYLIGLYQVDVPSKAQLHRNRKGLRDLLSNVYSNDVDAALVVFVQEEKWRFTYVSEITTKEDGKRKKKTTDPKRYTYLFGKGEKAKTAAQQFAKIKIENELHYQRIKLQALNDFFNVDKMSKAFFDEYRQHYGKFTAYITGEDENQKKVGKAHALFKSTFNSQAKEARDFVKKMLGRIVFLYFLEKKGWLGVPVDGDWGDGDVNFLSNLFKQSEDKDAFYSNVLSDLFFKALNTERKDHIYKLPTGEKVKIPFLNGGLFEEDDYNTQLLQFPKKLFAELFDFFDRYNFTVYEDSPDEHTVAVDPEMLGHIFENLLEDNKDKGAYYTPKEIVHYMCQESLIEYLYTKINPGVKAELDSTGKAKAEVLSREALERFIRHHEALGINDYEERILEALRDVKVCDPAIGSGAFPMGVLMEIYYAVETLFYLAPDTVNTKWKLGNNNQVFDAAKVKESIIQNSIYGVDIEQGAVDIARLRFWLSLVVDENEPKPLPNLDYKIVVGDSLLSKYNDVVIDIDWSPKNVTDEKAKKLITDQQVKLHLLQQKQHLFFISQHGNKEKLKGEIRNLKIEILINQVEITLNQFKKANPFINALYPTGKDKLINQEIQEQTALYTDTLEQLRALRKSKMGLLEFFDWKLDFPEVMNEKVKKSTGFDIVIGNPPYGAKINRDENPEIIKAYSKVVTGEIETYVLFYYRGLQLLNGIGSLCFITPDSWLTNRSTALFRKSLCEQTDLIDIYDFYKPFPTAKDTRVHSVLLKQSSSQSMIRVKQVQPGNLKKIYRNYLVDQEVIKNFGDREWRLYLTPAERKIFSKMERTSKPLSENFNIKYGLRTGNNAKYLTDQKSKYPVVAGSDIADLYALNWTPKYLKTIKELPQAYFNENFSRQKLIIQYVRTNSLDINARWLEATYIYGDYIPLNSLSFVYPKTSSRLKYLLAILNSFLMNRYYRAYYTDVNVKPTYLSQLPIPEVSEGIEKKFESLVSQILELRNKNVRADIISLQKHLDIMVFKLYSLSYEEATILFGSQLWVSQNEYDLFDLRTSSQPVS